MSHGKGCGSEVPASYSSVAGSMCWVDWVMSVVPLAKYDVDDREVEEDGATELCHLTPQTSSPRLLRES